MYVSHAYRTETLTVYRFLAFSCRLQSSLKLAYYGEGYMEAFDVRWHIKRGECVAEHRGR